VVVEAGGVSGDDNVAGGVPAPFPQAANPNQRSTRPAAVLKGIKVLYIISQIIPAFKSSDFREILTLFYGVIDKERIQYTL